VIAVKLYRDEYWEVYDPDRGEILAHFFDGKMAQQYVEWLRSELEKRPARKN